MARWIAPFLGRTAGRWVGAVPWHRQLLVWQAACLLVRSAGRFVEWFTALRAVTACPVVEFPGAGSDGRTVTRYANVLTARRYRQSGVDCFYWWTTNVEGGVSVAGNRSGVERPVRELVECWHLRLRQWLGGRNVQPGVAVGVRRLGSFSVS